MVHKKIIASGLIALGIIALIAVVLYIKYSDKEQENQDSHNQEVSTDTPANIALDFYSPWLEAVKSTSTSPYALGLATEKILSEKLRDRLVSSEGQAETEIDPVLCQTTIPERVTGRIVSEQENVVRVLIMAKDPVLTAQSVFTLRRQNDGWFIDDILCAPGEFDTPREFSFDKEGYLLKNVPPPLNPEYWHLVFEENGVRGHATPLLFSAESSCIATDAHVAVCSPDQFIEATKVHVYGQMTESGAQVTRLQFIE